MASQRPAPHLMLTLLIAAALLCGSACTAEGGKEPDRVVVQHILIAFEGKLPGKTISRNEEEARRLAHDLLERARGGEDFDALVREHTDDSHPGIYGMANRGLSPSGENEFGRDQMVPGFGDVAFSLPPDAIGLCEFDGLKSPFGYHVIKRLK